MRAPDISVFGAPEAWFRRGPGALDRQARKVMGEHGPDSSLRTCATRQEHLDTVLIEHVSFGVYDHDIGQGGGCTRDRLACRRRQTRRRARVAFRRVFERFDEQGLERVPGSDCDSSRSVRSSTTAKRAAARRSKSQSIRASCPRRSMRPAALQGDLQRKADGCALPPGA